MIEPLVFTAEAAASVRPGRAKDVTQAIARHGIQVFGTSADRDKVLDALRERPETDDTKLWEALVQHGEYLVLDEPALSQLPYVTEPSDEILGAWANHVRVALLPEEQATKLGCSSDEMSCMLFESSKRPLEVAKAHEPPIAPKTLGPLAKLDTVVCDGGIERARLGEKHFKGLARWSDEVAIVDRELATCLVAHERLDRVADGTLATEAHEFEWLLSCLGAWCHAGTKVKVITGRGATWGTKPYRTAHARRDVMRPCRARDRDVSHALSRVCRRVLEGPQQSRVTAVELVVVDPAELKAPYIRFRDWGLYTLHEGLRPLRFETPPPGWLLQYHPRVPAAQDDRFGPLREVERAAEQQSPVIPVWGA